MKNHPDIRFVRAYVYAVSRFIVIAASAGMGSTSTLSGQEHDCDTHPDLSERAYTKTMFRGDPFTKVTEGEIVSNGGRSTGCSWIDYDNDSDLDLYVCNYGHNNFFYVNNGDGTFTRITATLLIHPGNSNAANWADCDNDLDADVIVANNGTYQDMESWFTNNGDESFTQIVDGPVANDGGDSQGICWGDYDNDGFIDLFIPNGFSVPRDNSLYRNNGDGTFAKIVEGQIDSPSGARTFPPGRGRRIPPSGP
jgi:hypothetical protein